MKTFDVMLFTSRYEPFGLVLTEAMAAGVPLVAMDAAGAVSEIVRHETDGIVVKGLKRRPPPPRLSVCWKNLGLLTNLRGMRLSGCAPNSPCRGMPQWWKTNTGPCWNVSGPDVIPN